MEAIPVSEAVQIEQEPSLPAKRVFTARADGRKWAVKAPVWLGYSHVFSIRLGMEMFYFALAKQNKLPMPDSRILHVKSPNLVMPDGRAYPFPDLNCWGTEFIPGGALGEVDHPLSAAMLEKLEAVFENTPAEMEAYLRAVFLDVLLRNFDRKVGNVLKVETADSLALLYFDHEQSFGWRANVQSFGRNRIKSPVEEWAEIDRNVSLERTYRWAAKYSTIEARQQLFESLDLRVSMLDEVMSQVRDNWIYPDQLADMKKGLDDWWGFLRAKPYVELDHRIFGA